MIENINLNLYRVFYYVAITKSFNRAAEMLCVSQPAISKQIKNLEDILDVKLFYRFNKGVDLTEEGKILMHQIEKMSFYLEASLKYLSNSKELVTGQLTIGCPSHITSFYLLEYIERFRKDYKGINIKIINDSTSLLIDSLIHHKIDFIIDSSPIELSSKDLVLKKIGEFNTIFIASNKYSDNIKHIEDLRNVNLILPLPRSSMRQNLEKELSKYDIELNVGLSVDTTDLIITSVKRGLGIGYVVKEAIKEEIKNGTIKELGIDCEMPKLELNLVYVNGYLSHPAQRFLKEYLKAI